MRPGDRREAIGVASHKGYLYGNSISIPSTLLHGPQLFSYTREPMLNMAFFRDSKASLIRNAAVGISKAVRLDHPLVYLIKLRYVFIRIMMLMDIIRKPV